MTEDDGLGRRTASKVLKSIYNIKQKNHKKKTCIEHSKVSVKVPEGCLAT